MAHEHSSRPDHGEHVYCEYPQRCDACGSEIPAQETYKLFRSHNKRACIACATRAPRKVEVAA